MKEGKNIRKVNGKRVQIHEHELIVSGDVLELIETGILTSQKMEIAAGITKETYADGSAAAIEMMTENREKLYKEFLPQFVLSPKDFKPDDYTDDDLWDIVITVYNRAIRRLGTRGEKEAESFPENTDRADNSDAGPPEKKAGE